MALIDPSPLASLHFGFKSSGSHFLHFHSIRLEPSERPKDLHQRLNSFVEDNLLKDRTSVPGSMVPST